MPQIFLTAIAVALRIVSNPAANVFQKRLGSRELHPLLVNFLTYFLLSLACIFIALAVSWPTLAASFWIYSVLAGIAGAAGNGFLVKALQSGELSVLGPVNSYKAVVGIVIGAFLLGEIPNSWGIAGMALIIWGSYFVLDTTEDRFSLVLFKRKAIQYRIWAMVLTGIEAVFIKRIILASSVPVAFISWCVAGAFFSLLFLMLNKLNIVSESKKISSRSITELFYLVACVGVMQAATNYTFHYMPVGYALSLFQLSTIVSVWLGYRIFKEKDIRKKMIGSVIMIVGSVIIILLK